MLILRDIVKLCLLFFFVVSAVAILEPRTTDVEVDRIQSAPVFYKTPEPPPTPTPVPSTPKPTPKPQKAVQASEKPRAVKAAVAVKPGSVKARIVAVWPGDDAKALRVVGCESNFNPRAVSKSGKYHGLWQFDAQTYRSVGGTPPASKDSVEEQTRRAWKLKQQRSWRPWPVCGKR